MYYGFVGAVSAVSASLVKQVNGHSNDYWGWGMEDDDFSKRFFLFGF